MKIIAITGNPASGKSTILGLLRKHGMPTHSADDAAASFYKTESDALHSIFGTSLNSKDAMMEILYRNSHMWKELEALIHPFVKEDRQKFLDMQRDTALVACEVPLLFECGMENQFDAIVLAVAPLKVRKARFPSPWFSTLEERFFSQGKKMLMTQNVIFTNKAMGALEKEVLHFAQEVLIG